MNWHFYRSYRLLTVASAEGKTAQLKSCELTVNS
jgi:hypothetical protein